MRETKKMRGRVGRVAMVLTVAAICAAQRPVAGMQTGTPPSGTHQTGGTAPASVGGTSTLGGAGSLDTMTSPFPDNSRQKRNDDRQRRLVSDTQRLLTLTAQLKAEVANLGAESMSPEMLKQMEEIEKLAKSVKDKMRN